MVIAAKKAHGKCIAIEHVVDYTVIMKKLLLEILWAYKKTQLT